MRNTTLERRLQGRVFSHEAPILTRTSNGCLYIRHSTLSSGRAAWRQLLLMDRGIHTALKSWTPVTAVYSTPENSGYWTPKIAAYSVGACGVVLS